MTQIISTTLVNTLANTIANTFNNGSLEIYAGSPGTTPEDVSGGTFLLSMPLPIDAFNTASSGTITMAGQWFGTVATSGTAAWARLCDPTNALHIVLTVSSTSGNILIGNTALTNGGVVQINSFSFTVPDTASGSNSSNLQASVVGRAGTGSVGVLTVQTSNVSTSVTGVATTGSVGNVRIAGSADTVNLPAVAATGSAGIATTQTNDSVNLAAVAGTTAVGTLTTLKLQTATATGVAGTGAAGTPTTQTSSSASLPSVAGTGSAGTLTTQKSAPILTGVAATGTAGTAMMYFSINSSGNIISPTGQTWTAQGINVLDDDLPNVTLSLINSLFSNNINFIRLACGGGASNYLDAQSNSTIQTWVNSITNNGAGPIVVMIENHDTNQPAAYTGATLAAEQAWYLALATLFKDNPYVWFASMNEPGSGAVSAQHLATYNTIRSVSNTLVGFSVLGGFDYPDDASVYSSMFGVFFDIHFYNWMTYDGSDTCPVVTTPTNQTQVNSALTTYIENFNGFASSATCPMVTCIMECGFSDYAHDPTVEVNGGNGTNQVVIAALTIGQSIGRGACIWLWAGVYDFGNACTDLVDQGTNTLTQHGTVVLAHI